MEGLPGRSSQPYVVMIGSPASLVATLLWFSFSTAFERGLACRAVASKLGVFGEPGFAFSYAAAAFTSKLGVSK